MQRSNKDPLRAPVEKSPRYSNSKDKLVKEQPLASYDMNDLIDDECNVQPLEQPSLPTEDNSSLLDAVEKATDLADE